MDSSYWNQFKIIPSLYLLKPPHFSEEAEWRLHTIATRGFPGACAYRALDDKLVPYVKLEMADRASGIDNVVLGPKYVGDETAVRAFLRSSGFRSANVSRSEIGYR